MKYASPCTGNVGISGFGEYLEREIAEPRRNIRLFASELKSRFGGAYHCLVNSGSSANLVSAFAVAEKLRKADKPLTAIASAFTFPTTMSALAFAGFHVRLIDVERDGFNLSVDALQRETPASLIVPTHFLGFPYDVEGVRRIAEEWGALILQDACETLDVPGCGRRNFDGADFITWSFYHPHHLSSYGGGCVVCRTAENFALVDSIAHWGRACKCHIDPSLCRVPAGPSHEFTYERPGFNLELSELNACFGRWQLTRWDEYERIRKSHYDRLFSALQDSKFKTWRRPEGGSPFVFPFVLPAELDADEVHSRLAAAGVETRRLMGGVLARQPGFLNVDAAPCPNARHLAATTLFAGIHQTLNEAQIACSASAILDL